MTAAKRNLARKLNRPSADVRAAPSSPWVVGTVTAVSLSTNSVTVTMQGDTTAIPGVSFLDSYMPVVGDTVILVRIKQHLWVVGSVAGSYAPIVGPGASTNYVSGGANRANTEPFTYTASMVGSTTSTGVWAFTTSGVTFNGVGSITVAPADNSGGLAFLNAQTSRCSISGGNLNVGGNAYTPTGGNVISALIRVSLTVVGW
jgi:hypothetical protein